MSGSMDDRSTTPGSGNGRSDASGNALSRLSRLSKASLAGAKSILVSTTSKAVQFLKPDGELIKWYSCVYPKYIGTCRSLKNISVFFCTRLLGNSNNTTSNIRGKHS